MKAYDVVTKFYDGKWQTEPELIHTFYNEADAWRFIAYISVDNDFARQTLRLSLYDYWRGKSKTFGVGLKMYCIVREI